MFLKLLLIAGSFYAIATSASAAVTYPTFADRYNYGGGCLPDFYNFAAGDVNGDGIPDLVCSNTLAILTVLGKGDGTFRAGPSSSFSPYEVSNPIVLDLNGDGINDIAAVATLGFQLGILVAFGNGDGAFHFSGFYPTGSDSYLLHIIVADFNGDGIQDLATQGESGVWLLAGQAGGIFKPAVPTPVNDSLDAGYQLAASDVNGDGKVDVFAGIRSGFAVLLGNGDGTFQPEIDTSVPNILSRYAVGDLNGDGKPDVFVETQAVYGLLYVGNGDGTFTLTRQVNIGAVQALAIADVNGDGFLDVVSSEGDIVFGEGKGYFSSPVYYPVDDTLAVLPFDLRNNGRIDLIYSYFTGGLTVLLNEGRGKFEDGESVPVSGGGARCAVSYDFNGDGIPDLATAVDSGTSILLGTGKLASPYRQGQVLSYPLYSFSCPVIGNFNSDGIADLLVTSGSGTAITFLGNGDGTFTQVAKTTPLSSNGILAIGDFNGDGKTDFALSSNLLAYGNGDGTFQTPVPFIPQLISDNISSIAAARLNGDREEDIVLTDSAANLVYVLLSNGAKGFTQTTFNSDINGGCYAPVNIALADVNGDGHRDLVLGCNAPAVPIYLNNGAGVFTFSGVSLNSQFNGAYPLVEDVNGDGVADIVVQNGFLNIFLGLGSGTFGVGPSIGTGSLSGPVLAVDAHGQRLSGKPDLLAPDGSGVVYIYFNTTE